MLRLAPLLLLATSGTVAAQILQPPGRQQPPPFKPFAGQNAERFLNSSVGRWADQIELELDSLRTVTNAAQLRPFTKQSIVAQAQRGTEAVADLQRIARRGGNRDQLRRAYDTIDAALADLNGVVRSDLQAGPVLAQPLARITYANRQLDATIDSGVPNGGGDGGRRLIAKLADALSDQSDELRSVIEDATGNNLDRQLDQAVRSFTRAARKMDRTLEDGGDVRQAQADFNGVATTWQQAAAILGRNPAVPPTVRAQAARVDGLYRKLATVLAGGNPGNGPGPGNPGWPVVPPGPGFIPAKAAVIAVGAGEGGGPRVRVYHDLRGEPAYDFFAYDSNFRGGVRVAVADLNGDNIPDLVTAPGPGMPALIRVFNGQDMSLLLEFNGMDPNWQGGAFVAAADMGDTRQALVAVGGDVGAGPRVQIYDLTQGKQVDTFDCFDPNMRGGLRVAYGDVDADGIPDLIAAQGPCDHNPTVRMFNQQRKIVGEMNVFDPQWRGGVWIAAADITRNGRANLLVGTDAGTPAQVKLFDLQAQREIGEWSPFPRRFLGGARVSARDVNGDGVLDIICVPGNGLEDTPLRVFDGRNGRSLANVPVIPGFSGGGFVASK